MGTFVKRGFVFILLSVLIYCAIFITLFLVKLGDTPLIYRTSNTYYLFGGDTYQRFHEFNKSDVYDAIILGSSHAYRGYNTEVFGSEGLKVFNLGSSGQSLFNTKVIESNLINKNNCKLVILDIYPGTLQSDGFESTADLIANVSSDKLALELAKEAQDIRSVNMLFLRYLTHKFAGKPYYEEKDYVSGGYVRNRDSVKTKLNYESYFKSYNSSNKNMEALGQILSGLKSKGIPCILVNHPAPKEISEEKYVRYIREMNELADSYGVEFKNYIHDHNLDSKNHFYDYHHLNYAGATIFNQRLIAYLREKSYL